MAASTAERIVDAARACLVTEGYAALSTRRVADAAGVPLSQIHYWFRSRQGLVLAVLAAEDRRLVERQRAMYGTERPLWQRYEQACDFLETDLDSGYVRVLQEMIAAGWSDPMVAREVLRLQASWFEVLAAVAGEAQERLRGLGGVPPADVAALVGLAFLGGEALLLLGDERWAAMVRSALRSLVPVIRAAEESVDAPPRPRPTRNRRPHARR